jgi:hypothetical protein
MTPEDVLKDAKKRYILERAGEAYNRQKDEEARRNPDPSTLGPRVSKLDAEGRKEEVLSRVQDKPDVGMGLGEADLETTSAEPLVGVGEAALSLGSGMITWGAGKVRGYS